MRKTNGSRRPPSLRGRITCRITVRPRAAPPSTHGGEKNLEGSPQRGRVEAGHVAGAKLWPKFKTMRKIFPRRRGAQEATGRAIDYCKARSLHFLFEGTRLTPITPPAIARALRPFAVTRGGVAQLARAEES